MSRKIIPDKKRIELLVSFLDEKDKEVLDNIFNELLLLDAEGNDFLKSLYIDIENDDVLKRLMEVINRNNFRLRLDALRQAADSGSTDMFKWLCMITSLEYPDLDAGKLTMHLQKWVKKIWLKLESPPEAFNTVGVLSEGFKERGLFNTVANENVSIKHLMLNEVMESGETCNLYVNYLYICISRFLDIPVVPLRLFGLLVLAFENSGIYKISIIKNKYLFFIENQNFEPFPESKVRQNFKLPEQGALPLEPFSDKDLALVLLNWLAALYEKEGINYKAIAIRGLVKDLTAGKSVNEGA